MAISQHQRISDNILLFGASVALIGGTKLIPHAKDQ